MTLHDTTELLKKSGVVSTIGVVAIIVMVILIRVGLNIYDSLNPPEKDLPTQTFGVLPPLDFPPNAADNNFTYTLQTTTGELPATFPDGSTLIPDRLNVFPIIESPPNFLNLENAKKKVANLAFISETGDTVPEIQLTDPYYEWNEQLGFKRKIVFNINSFDFKMTSNYLSSLTVLAAKNIYDELSAIGVARGFLQSVQLVPKDLDIAKTETRNNPLHYVTYPEIYSIESGPEGNTLVRATSLSKTQVIRVDFYQKDIEYDLNTGAKDERSKKAHMKIPIVYPKPPYSTMSFWIASGKTDAMVTQAFFTHRDIDITQNEATYAIKTPEEAFNELKAGKAYIAAYWGNDSNIIIKDVYLAYYFGEDSKDYLMPVYVFEGKDGFFGYVRALSEEKPEEKIEN